MPLSTTTFDSIIIIKLIKMARNDYNFEMEDVAEDVQSPQEKVASSVENKDNSNVDNSYERKRLESNIALLKEVEELARSINEKYNEINAMYETAIGNEKDRLQGLKNILEQCKSMYSNISSYIGSAQDALANITVTISKEARGNIKEGVQEGVQEAYADERKKHIDELETYKKEFLVSFKRDLNDAALEVVDEVRKSYKGMFWKTLIIAYACMLITTTAVYKIFGDSYAWLAIVGILLVGVDFCVWIYRFVDRFGSK